LKWDAVPGAAQYRIYRSSTQGVTGSLVATSNTNEYVDVPGAHSYYQVSAVSSNGLEGERSVEVCGAVVGDPC
jgi:fibronectin type 3 domain-containing protein